jgi:tetratricopeptide (TPR) repeat protein
MLSYPRTDELFEGGAPPSTWFYAFEEDRGAAVQDLLLGAADLGPYQTLDPWAVVLPWLQAFSDTGLSADFDAALTEWITASWGKPIHPASYGSAALTARAWESASLIIANFDRLPISARTLRDRVLEDRQFLAFMGEGPSRDPAGRAWQALAQYQEDDSLFEEWNHILALDPGVPWYHGQYGLMGADLLPGNRGGTGIPAPLAYGLRRFGNGLLRLVTDHYLNEGNARREFERLSRWAQKRYPFKNAWRSVWRQLIEGENNPLAPWVFESLGVDHGAQGGKVEGDKWQLPRPAGDWFNRVQQIRPQLKRPTRAVMDAANTLLSEMETYYYATSDSYNFVRTACNLAAVLPDRWLESWIPWLEKAARFDPADPYPATHLAAALVKTGNLAKAERVARSGVYHFPLNVFVFNELGQVLKTAGKLGEAERVFCETVQRFPNDAVARNGLGGVLKTAGKLGEAESVYRETIQRFPNDLFARNGLAEVLKAARELSEAESVYRETIQRFPNDLFARNGLAEVLKAASKLSEAESVYRETVGRFPNELFARNGLGQVLYVAGKLTEAESVYRETVRRFTNDLFARNGLAEVLRAAGKLTEAESAYRETVQRFRNDEVARNGLAEVLKAAGKLTEAESVYRETVQRFPNDAAARNGLAEVLRAAGKLGEAESVYRETVHRFPRDRYATTGLKSIDQLRHSPSEVDLPDFDGELIPDFDGELVPDFDAELIPDLDEEVRSPSAGTVGPAPSDRDESLAPLEMRTGGGVDSAKADSESAAYEGAPEKGEPPALGRGSFLTRPSGGDLRPSRPSDFTPGFLRASDVDVLIQDSHLLRKWARGTGEEAISHIREEARSLLNKLERFLRSSPAAVMESSLLLIETQDIQAALRLLDEAAARYPASKRVQYALARTRREAARQASQERHPPQFDSPETAGIARAWAQLAHLEPVLLPSARLGLVRSLPYLTDGHQLKKAQGSALGQLAHALRSLQPDSDTGNPRSYWAYRVGELVLGDRAVEIRGASEVSDDDIDLAWRNCEQNLLALNGLEEDLLLYYRVS